MDALEEYKKWIDAPIDAQTRKALLTLGGDEIAIRECFSKNMDFGTAGLRERMGPGPNRMNIYTVRHTTQGLTELIIDAKARDKGVCITHDCRNNSRSFAVEAALVLCANGIKVFLFDDMRPTPELSFAVRHLQAISGINITASHNTREYNGYKVYWSDGAQLPSAHSDEIVRKLEKIDIFKDVKTCSFEEAQKNGFIRIVGDEIDEAYLEKVLSQSVRRPSGNAAGNVRIVYTPFHGTGYKLVPEALRRAGITDVIMVPQQAVPDGNFPSVASPNPESAEGFALAIELAKETGADLILGTDPDADRTGVAVCTRQGAYSVLSGNQIGVLLLEYILSGRSASGRLPEDPACITSIVSTKLSAKICEAYGVSLFEVLTGFKNIGEKIKEFEDTGSHHFVCGFEESNGYLSGDYARDKDAVVACMLLGEYACKLKEENLSIFDALMSIYEKYGYYDEEVISVAHEGIDGAQAMKCIMNRLRKNPPTQIGRLRVMNIRDYLSGEIRSLGTGETSPTKLHRSDVLYYELESDCAFVVRPSGTEPKIKFYVLASGKNRSDCELKKQNLAAAAGALNKINA